MTRDTGKCLLPVLSALIWEKIYELLVGINVTVRYVRVTVLSGCPKSGVMGGIHDCLGTGEICSEVWGCQWSSPPGEGGGGRGEKPLLASSPVKNWFQTAPPKFMPEFSSCLILLAKNFGISEMQHVSVTHSLYLQLTYILTAPINYINPTIYKPTKMRTIHGKIPQIHQRVQLLPL